MGNGRKKVFRDVLGAVKSYHGQFRVRLMNNNVHNFIIEKKEMTPKEFVDTYRRQNENRGLGSYVYYDSEMEIIWSVGENPDGNQPCIYLSKLPKTLGGRLYNGVRGVFSRSNRSAGI